MNHLMNLSQRYHRTKGYLEQQQEEPPLGQSGAPCRAGGECFAPCFDNNDKHNEALCASTKILCSGIVIWFTETSFRGQFSWFLKIVEEHPNGSKLTPGYPWWLPDITWVILARFWEHQFFIIFTILVEVCPSSKGSRFRTKKVLIPS